MNLPRCPEQLPPDYIKNLKQLCLVWAKSAARPRVQRDMIKKWDKLLDAWIADEKLPLFIRKHSNNRGTELKHNKSHRVIVPADNGPAHWVMLRALNGVCPSKKKIHEMIADIPVAMALRKSEKKKCKYNAKSEREINNKDWKLCHTEDIRLKNAHGKKLEDVDLEALKEHFRLFLSPRNMFLVPKKHSGIGELKEMRKAVKRYQE